MSTGLLGPWCIMSVPKAITFVKFARYQNLVLSELEDKIIALEPGDP